MMVRSHARFIYLEGFYQLFREMTRGKVYNHVFYYPKDVVRNKLSLQE